MQDPILAIDLEWRPTFGPGRVTPVAMIQVASARMALLVRTCRMQYRLAPELLALLQDPSVRMVGFGWDSADEGKMQGTFNVGAASFPGFLDLQRVARGLGWHGYGLARLTKAVLGTPLPKSKRVTMSNWENKVLTRPQVKYAALDVLIAGQVFRGLRLWHRAPTPCAGCLQLIGAVQPPPALACDAAGCGREYGGNVQAYLTHCRSSGHAAAVGECAACGCLRPAAALVGQEAAAQGPEQAARSALAAIGSKPAAAAAAAGGDDQVEVEMEAEPVVVGAAAADEGGEEDEEEAQQRPEKRRRTSSDA